MKINLNKIKIDNKEKNEEDFNIYNFKIYIILKSLVKEEN